MTPSPPSPCDRLSRLRVLWSDLTPPPPFGWPSFCWSFLPCQGREAAGVSQVPVYLSPCMPRPPTPAGAQHPVHPDAFLLASPCLTGSPPASFMVTRLDIFGRGASHPTACMVPCVCLRHVVRLSAFLHNANTWYGWLTIPYPTRTFTSQEAPSFAWRTRRPCRKSHPPGAEETAAGRFGKGWVCLKTATPRLSGRTLRS